MSYPSARYHENEEPRLVRDQEEDAAALAAGWSKDPSGLPQTETLVPAAPPSDLQAQLDAVTGQRDELAALIERAAESNAQLEKAVAAVTAERDAALRELSKATKALAKKAVAAAEPEAKPE